MSRFLKIAKLTNKQYGYTNKVYVNPKELEALGVVDNDIVVINDKICYQITIDSSLPIGCIGTNGLVWNALNLQKGSIIGTAVSVANWKSSINQTIANIIGTLKMNLKTYSKPNKITLDRKDITTHIIQLFQNQMFSPKQEFIFKYKYWWFKIDILEMSRFRNKKEIKNNDDSIDNNLPPSYETIEGQINDENVSTNKNLLKFGSIEIDETSLDIILDQTSSMKWKNYDNAPTWNDDIYDIDVTMDDMKSNDDRTEIKTARFTVNGKAQKYILLPYDDAVKVLKEIGYVKQQNSGEIVLTKAWFYQARKK